MNIQTLDMFGDRYQVRYAYLGTGEFATIDALVRRRGGNMLALESKNSIQESMLYGDRIRFLNIPNITYTLVNGRQTKTQVVILVDIKRGEETDIWMVQVPFAQYYTAKKHILTTFQYLYR